MLNFRPKKPRKNTRIFNYIIRYWLIDRLPSTASYHTWIIFLYVVCYACIRILLFEQCEYIYHIVYRQTEYSCIVGYTMAEKCMSKRWQFPISYSHVHLHKVEIMFIDIPTIFRRSLHVNQIVVVLCTIQDALHTVLYVLVCNAYFHMWPNIYAVLYLLWCLSASWTNGFGKSRLR